jgi:hypothetical protein
MATQYPATSRIAGEEGSITDQGRYLTFVESDLIHPTHTDGLADKGDPVNIGNIVGVVSSSSPTATTDLVTVDTEGIWYSNVVASNGSGTSAVALGDDLYIATGIISKIATGIPFGKAMGALSGSATAALCAVKVHMPVPEGTMVGTNFQASYGPFAAAQITAANMFFVAPAACKVLSASFSHTTVAGQAGTMQVEKCTSGEAAGAGDAILAAALNLVGTTLVPETVASTLNAAASMAAGDVLRLKLASGADASFADGALTLLMQWL